MVVVASMSPERESEHHTSALGNLQLQTHARNLGDSLRSCSENIEKWFKHLPSFEEAVETVGLGYRTAVEWAAIDEDRSPIVEWLLDNYYVVQERIEEIRLDLPSGFLRELPKVKGGRARIQVLAAELLLRCDCALDEGLIVDFANAFQENCSLTIGESWAYSTMLKIGLVERLAEICQQLIDDFQGRNEVEQIIQRLLSSPFDVLSEVRKLKNRSAILRLNRYLRDDPTTESSALAILNDHLKSIGWTISDLQNSEQHRIAASQVSIGNAITSIRMMAALDWPELFEAINCTEKLLREDAIYANMDFSTRNLYRSVIEELSKGSKFQESDVATLALDLAERNSRRSGQGEHPAVANHVGYWLVDAGRLELEKQIRFRPALRVALYHAIHRNASAVFFSGIGGLTIAVLGLMGLLLWLAGSSIAMASILCLAVSVPASEVAILIWNALLTRFLPVDVRPKLEFTEDIPDLFPTFVVIPSMLSSLNEVRSLLNKIENHYLANNDPQIFFALLTDFPDATQATLESDDALVQEAVVGIQRLNERYGSEKHPAPFYLFHRERLWNPLEEKWMGWERKRGKLLEFGALLLRGDTKSYVVQEGDLSQLDRFRDPNKTPYVITLDSDTILPRDAAKKLVGAAAHPLNHPEQPTQRGDRVTRGYTIFQPRVSIHLGEQARSRYLHVHSGRSGIDPYVIAASDVYQDLFGEGSFTGKGIYDLRMFEQALQDRFPENRILSHDLIEGSFARVALVSDVEMFDTYPSRYDADIKRQHRWVRGDWQIASWLFPSIPNARSAQPNVLSALSRWKIFDNLRRSLIAPMLMLFLFLAWYSGDNVAWVGTLVGWMVVLTPVVIQAAVGLGSWNRRIDWILGLHRYGRELLRAIELSLYGLMFLPHRAVSMLDAILRTLYRLVISHRKLLQWETAASVEERLRNHRWAIVQQLMVCSVAAIAALVIAPGYSKLAVLPVGGFWLFAPLVGHAISHAKKASWVKTEAEDKGLLLEITAGTWGYFETYVNEAGGWLPPDNVQEYPAEKVAYRISPTNEGLFLVSGLVAHQLGFATFGSLAELLEKNLDAWMQLPTRNGHHYNWYESRHGEPLNPRYISTVDSGNLLASYLTAVNGITALMDKPIVGQHSIDAAQASIAWVHRTVLLRQALAHKNRSKQGAANAYAELASFLEKMAQRWGALTLSWSGLRAFGDQLEIATIELDTKSEKLRSTLPVDDAQIFQKLFATVAQRFRNMRSEMQSLFPWVFQETIAPASYTVSLSAGLPITDANSIPFEINLRELAQLPKRLADQVAANGSAAAGESFAALVRRGALAAQSLRDRLIALRLRCEQAAEAMDFSFLYSKRRKLFSIGLNIETGNLDKGFYDLLCSECRLASYLAIAKGDVETEHWFRLGRQTTKLLGSFSLLSWGGTMFEYLMPPLFLKSYESSLLDSSCRTAIARQKEYGFQKSTPWGTSESAFSALSLNSDYQYKSFGVPGLGLKRGLSREHVISPYSSILAVPFAPAMAIENLREMTSFALGTWGYYDAIDYTQSRLRKGEPYRVVQNYMAHHHGMSMLAVANALQDNIVQKWFHATPMIRANELLLEEKVPEVIALQSPHAEELEGQNIVRSDVSLVSRQIRGYQSVVPKTHLLSNGHFSTMITQAGGSYCQFDDLQVTRWRSDSTRDSWGMYIYFRDEASSEVWSATYQPTCVEPDDYQVIYSLDKAEIRRRQNHIESLMELVVSPEHNSEIRQLRLTNNGHQTRTIEVTSYAEIVLATAQADMAHSAFQKLFVETEFVAEDASLVAHRRPRDKNQASVYAVHTLAVQPEWADSVQFESSREEFLGRGRSTENPIALEKSNLVQKTGAVLDPIFCLRCRVQLEPGESVTLGFTTAIAQSREEALFLADFYHDLRGVQRAMELAWAFAQAELRNIKFSAKQMHLFQQLGGYLLYPNGVAQGCGNSVACNRLSQNALWRFGISGDKPILLLHVADSNDMEIVRDCLNAQRFLDSKGLLFDLVISNDYPGTYFDSVQEEIQLTINSHGHPELQARHIFLLRTAQLSPEDNRLLESVASVVLHGKSGRLEQQVRSLDGHPVASAHMATNVPRVSNKFIRKEPPHPSAETVRIASVEEEQVFENGYGRFDGASYAIECDSSKPTPAPWSNVLANPNFGCLVTESGGGYTWFRNSRENKLTTWSNDPITDTPSEIVYLRDASRGSVWSPIQPLDPQGKFRVVHGHGVSKFSTTQCEIESETTICVDTASSVKYVSLMMHNVGSSSRTLEVTYYAETVLGVVREGTVDQQVSKFEPETASLTMRNGYHPDFNEQVLFLTAIEQSDVQWTADRRSFLGRHGSWRHPVGIANPLDGATGARLDPCLAIRVRVTIPAGEKVEVLFALGAAENEGQLPEIQNSIQSVAQAKQRMQDAIAYWNRSLGHLQVTTPNPALDQMVNGWLLYQTIACRIFGRSAFYQSGGAYGFRDQLQDVMATVASMPQLAREHILRSAARQYVEGDVQHWWHPPSGKGTRTRFSDDFLFLPFVVAHYVRVTGDVQIMEERIPFLNSPVLSEHEHERYEQPQISDEQGTLAEHCVRALRHGMRYGPHRLPLMGCGDWNDGMSRIGLLGQGESVWVAWFQIQVFTEFSKLLHRIDQYAEVQEQLTISATLLRDAIEEHAWDGEWYKRAFFDDGTPLGSVTNTECSLDSLTQSWAVIAGGPTPRSQRAFQAAIDHLFRRKEQMLLLFDPPFDKGVLDPGYIQGYIPGVRENGGQYTHAALWMVQAAAQLNDGDLAMELMDALNPIHHSKDPENAQRYRLEPYVVAADVYSNPQHVGRGGWSWYTGSASWMYRIAVEHLLGIRRIENRVYFCPVVPKSWDRFYVTLRSGKSTWNIQIVLESESAQPIPEAMIELEDDGQDHDLVIVCKRAEEIMEAKLSGK